MVTVLNSVGNRFWVFSKVRLTSASPAGRAGFGAIENKAVQVLTSQVADLLFTDHPADAVHDIGFTATIGANDTGYIIIKIDNSFISKTFKSFDFKTF